MKRRKLIRNADASSGGAVPGVEPGHELLAVLRPYVRHCGDSHRPAWQIGARKLLDYLLVYIADGRGRFSVGGHEYDAEPGDLFWIPPDTAHAMEGYAPGMHCPYVHFDLVYRPSHSHWDFSIPAGTMDLSELQPLMHPRVVHPLLQMLPGRIRGHTNRRVGQLIGDICAEAARAQPFAGLKMSGLMMEAVAEILRGRAGLPAEQMAHVPLLEKAGDEIIRRCSEDLNMTALARGCRLSPSHFRHLFRKHFGLAPREYIRRARLRLARELMVNTAMTISEIASHVGFETIHSFSRAFREVEGIAPSEYRRCAEVRTRVEGRKTPYSR
ncbi:MAG: hypothetical protein C0404_00410 [Verrucomicrobia bacterium]|nr:hypothetical protein [Verrucomicrobiota bacterium]